MSIYKWDESLQITEQIIQILVHHIKSSQIFITLKGNWQLY